MISLEKHGRLLGGCLFVSMTVMMNYGKKAGAMG